MELVFLGIGTSEPKRAMSVTSPLTWPSAHLIPQGGHFGTINCFIQLFRDGLADGPSELQIGFLIPSQGAVFVSCKLKMCLNCLLFYKESV